jgi:hypothetical protein
VVQLTEGSGSGYLYRTSDAIRGRNYIVNFGDAGNVEAWFVSPMSDSLQMLECESPTSPAGEVHISLRLSCDPDTPIGTNFIRFVFFEPSEKYVPLRTRCLLADSFAYRERLIRELLDH